MTDIKVYIKKACPWCVELQEFLDQKGVKYELIDVLQNIEKFQEMIAISGQPKAPTVVINGEVFADTDKETIEKVLIEKKIL